MTRNEQIETIARSLYNPTIDAERGKINAFIEGAKWSDRNPAAKEFKIASESYHRSKLVDWQQVRIQAAIAALQGLLSNEGMVRTLDAVCRSSDEVQERAARVSIKYADALVKELKGDRHE